MLTWLYVIKWKKSFLSFFFFLSFPFSFFLSFLLSTLFISAWSEINAKTLMYEMKAQSTKKSFLEKESWGTKNEYCFRFLFSFFVSFFRCFGGWPESVLVFLFYQPAPCLNHSKCHLGTFFFKNRIFFVNFFPGQKTHFCRVNKKWRKEERKEKKKMR